MWTINPHNKITRARLSYPEMTRQYAVKYAEKMCEICGKNSKNAEIKNLFRVT